MGGRVWGSKPSAAVLALLGVAFLTSAWIGTNPLGGAPDELDHELRALSIGRGQLVGDKLPAVEPTPQDPTCCAPDNASARSWVQRGARFVDVPSRINPLRVSCDHVVANESNRCRRPSSSAATTEEITTMGTIEAAAYAPSALASRLAWSPFSALILTRVASAACAVALVALGLIALRSNRRGPWVLLGALFALTPGVVLVFSSPSPNAIEISGAFAFFAGMLAATEPGPVARAETAAIWLGAFALVASRSLGPGWLILLTLVAIALNGAGAVRQRLAARRPVVIGLGIIGAALAVTVVWEAVVQPHVPFDAAFFLHQLRPALNQHDRITHEFVGVFGAVNVAMRDYVYSAWLWLLAALVVGAGILGTRRDALAIGGVFLACIAAFVGIAAAVLRQNGFDVQARHVLPIFMALPVVAGVVLARRLEPRWSPVALVVGAFLALIQLVAWAFNTAAYVRSPLGLVAEPVWGRAMLRLAADRWGWALIALMGATLLAMAPLAAARATRGRAPTYG